MLFSDMQEKNIEKIFDYLFMRKGIPTGFALLWESLV